MKMFLENREYVGNILSYPYKNENGRFEAIVCNRSETLCCITYTAKHGPFGNGEEEEISKICNENKIRHSFDEARNAVTLHRVPVNKSTFYILAKIDRVLGLPTEKLDETKLPPF